MPSKNSAKVVVDPVKELLRENDDIIEQTTQLTNTFQLFIHLLNNTSAALARTTSMLDMLTKETPVDGDS